MVDLAAMREAVKALGGDPKDVHPACPADLTVDHSLQIDFSRWYLNTTVNEDSQAGRPARAARGAGARVSAQSEAAVSRAGSVGGGGGQGSSVVQIWLLHGPELVNLTAVCFCCRFCVSA